MYINLADLIKETHQHNLNSFNQVKYSLECLIWAVKTEDADLIKDMLIKAEQGSKFQYKPLTVEIE